ncbi:GGDEF domain-containing protein [Acidisoma cellulosilytica]|uniref:diguanylate cyclase n=1 Tax=Acidisoma cellulosilyticum TaxID=2802395 RepID=A0A964E5H0_9PROT|nr:GGDEF domain-containing protein [Acidisoma cellulosilyticum]MCB8882422.1 GGDEF domain-containing protein [Acidisoma cellulosilyticum]
MTQFHLPEPLTMALTMTLVILATCLNYLVIWSQNRQQRALLWMVAASLLSGSTFIVRLIWPGLEGVIFAQPAVLTGVSCVWMGCRVAAGHRPRIAALPLPGAFWLLCACIPRFLHNPSARFAVSYLLVVPLLLLALRALWPSPIPKRAGRLFVSGLLGLLAVLCLAWGLLQAVSIFRDLGLGIDLTTVPVSAFAVMGFYLVLSFAFVALVKEESEWAHGRAAFTDALTGLPNRRSLDERLTAAVKGAQRDGQPLAVIMIDVDQFKAYNDRYGHPAGDACLQTVATCLQTSLPPERAEVMRYGGEEFTAVIRQTDARGAMALAERMRQAVAARHLPHEGGVIGVVSISLGIAVMEPQSRHTGVIDGISLIAAADRALYRAKETGRNRATLFTPADAEGVALRGRTRMSPGLST